MKIPKLACAALLAAFSAGAAAVGGLADLTVYDRSEGRSLPVYWHEGRAYVVGKPGNEYQLSVRNRQGEDVLAVMSVDGVNVITGETAGVQQSGYVLAPGARARRQGLAQEPRRDRGVLLHLAAGFLCRAHRPPRQRRRDRRRALPPEERPSPRRLSQIAPFARRATRRSAAPAAARRASAPRAAEAPLGTGHGRSEASHARHVGFERATSEPAETVVIYYDSYRNLLARGIIPRRTFRRAGPRRIPSRASSRSPA